MAGRAGPDQQLHGESGADKPGICDLRRPVGDAVLFEGQRSSRGPAVSVDGERFRAGGCNRERHREDPAAAGAGYHRPARTRSISSCGRRITRRPGARRAPARAGAKAQAGSDLARSRRRVAAACGAVEGAVRTDAGGDARAGARAAGAHHRLRQHRYRGGVLSEDQRRDARRRRSPRQRSRRCCRRARTRKRGKGDGRAVGARSQKKRISLWHRRDLPRRVRQHGRRESTQSASTPSCWRRPRATIRRRSKAGCGRGTAQGGGDGRQAWRARRACALRGFGGDADGGLGREQRHSDPGHSGIREPVALRAGRGARAAAHGLQHSDEQGRFKPRNTWTSTASRFR